MSVHPTFDKLLFSEQRRELKDLLEALTTIPHCFFQLVPTPNVILGKVVGAGWLVPSAQHVMWKTRFLFRLLAMSIR